MRVQPYTVDSYVHVVKRGARGMPITRRAEDQKRFLKLLYYLNDHNFNLNWERETANLKLFTQLKSWPDRKPLVDILAYCLMPNHFHLVLREIVPGGMSKFMQRLGNSMTSHFNLKYQERGSIFQGAFRARTVQNDDYFRYLSVYVMVKNTFELYPQEGLEAAGKNFEDVWRWALSYPFSSLPDYAGFRPVSPILKCGLLGEIFSDAQLFKEFSKECILGMKFKNFDFL